MGSLGACNARRQQRRSGKSVSEAGGTFHDAPLYHVPERSQAQRWPVKSKKNNVDNCAKACYN